MKYARAILADLLLGFAALCREYADRTDTRYASALNPGEPDD